jgi:E3 ubiquitin-protein ligase DOA10
MRRQIPILICFVFGLFMLVQYFVPHKYSLLAYQNVLDWMQIIYLFTLMVGALSFIKIQSKKIALKDKNWGFSVISLLGLLVMVIFGLFIGTGKDSAFLWVFDHFQAPMQTTMFSLLAFFVASAAYRGFRARSWEATLLLIVATIVMLGKVPLSNSISELIPKGAEWIINVPSMAARRGILIGIGLGSISTSLRIILGIERTYLGRG